jgi:E3 ubiquitin-protein ligase CHFR
VFRRDDNKNNVVYRFEDLTDDEQLLETQEYNEEDDDDDSTITITDDKPPTEDSTDNPAASDHTDEYEPPHKVARPSDSKDMPAISKEPSVMEQSLLCGICQEILHQCISLQPCMHSFCASCYSTWMERSRNCPHCRGKVHRLSKNHIVNNLVDAYLKAHPEKKRSDDELREMDARNKITEDMLYPKQKQHESGTEYSNGENSDENSDEDSSGSSNDYPSMRFGHSFAVRASPPMKCRQCPGYSSPLTAFSSTSLGTTASSVASDHVMVTPPPYTCPIPAVHILCHCCMQPMPNHLSDTTMPKQKCAICRQAYCHLYWGCRSPNCRGCLGSFKDINLADHHLNGILNNGNQYESDVLKNYLKAKGLSIRDLLQVCAARVDSGEYHCSGGILCPCYCQSPLEILLLLVFTMHRSNSIRHNSVL